ncbi:MAG: phosphotransferase family protein [Candidatus Adiutrix sp.]|jgi:thiamine kinase-like enzyme|nr:phosphotransferase family protein [Candidatus Adiutrix sp.]
MTDISSSHAAAQEILAKIPFWRGRPDFAIIHDGRTNSNFTAVDDRGKYFARFGIDLPHHFIFREHETRAARLAAELGVAPPLLYAAEGVMVCEFIEGRGLVIADGQSRALLFRIAGILRRLHQGRADSIGQVFDLDRILPAYVDRLPEGALPPDDLSRVCRVIDRLPKLSADCLIHSDLIPNNFLDDGRRLWLIDWEYAGLGHPSVDLAMVIANFDLPEDLARPLVEEHGLCSYEEVAAMTPALVVRELLWTLVQIGLVGLAGDLPEYREICFRRLRELPA